MTTVTITRRRDPLEGEPVVVLRRWRRKDGRMDLLVMLPNGRKRLIPQVWTDAGAGGDTADPGPTAILGGVEDFSVLTVLISALAVRAGEQAASQSTCEEDQNAACSAQSAGDRDTDTAAAGGRRASRRRRGRGGCAVGAADRESSDRSAGGDR